MSRNDIVKVDGSINYDYLGESIDGLSSQMADIVAMDRRKFKHKFCSALYIIQSETAQTPMTQSNILTLLQEHEEQGIDGIILLVHIEPTLNSQSSGNLEYIILETLENIKYLADQAIALGLEIRGIKCHQLYAQQNAGTIDMDNFFIQYKALIISLCETFKDYNIPYFTCMNEASNITNNDVYTTQLEDLLTTIKSYGFKTGFCGQDSVTVALQPYIDGIFFHIYPKITNKEANATFKDGVLGWSSSGAPERVRRIRKQYPSLPIIMTETGVQSNWSALALPEKYIWDNAVWDSTGMPQAIYMNGLFNVMNDEDFEDVWFLYEIEHIETKKIIHEYIKGEIING